MNDRERIAELEAKVERLERDLAQSQVLRRRAVASRDIQLATSKEARGQLKQLQGRRAVRMALGLSRHARRITAVVRKVVSIPRRAVRSFGRRGRSAAAERKRSGRATAAAEKALAAAIRDRMTPALVDHGPLVSIVILNRDGLGHLERCLRAVATTTYRDVEIIVVDNGSTDGSAGLAEGFALPFPMRVLRNTENRSFSDATDQAAAVATGELLCFLNNDVEPITEDWLGYMVETLTTPGAVAVGPRLIYPSNRGVTRAGARFADLTLQHRGVDFDRGEAVPLPRAMGAGEDPLAAPAVAVAEVPALTAACLLVSRAAFDAAGGFASAYDYGLEDVDLGLRLRAAGGRLVYDGRAALWHHESSTRAADPAVRRSRVARNREAYLDAWGPAVFRAALLDALQGGDRYSAAPVHLAILGHSAAEHRAVDLGGSLEELGWRVSRLILDPEGTVELDPSVEVVIVVDDAIDLWQLPSRLVSIASIDGDPARWLERPWFDDYDLVVTLDPEAAGTIQTRSSKTASVVPQGASGPAVRDAIAAWATATRYGLRVGVPTRDDVERWGDYHFARAVQRSLERGGHPTRVHLLPDWGSATAARDDVAVHLFGLKEAPTRRGQVNILWQISHPDLASPELYERYDQVFVASDLFATRMAERVAVPVSSLHQATDPERFRPERGGPHHELLFVANSRKVHRRIVDDLAGTDHDLAIYGANWTPELADPRFVKANGVPNAELARYYSAADIVLNDHWDDMLAEGFISNRLYDALACGAFIISDHIDGIEAEFDGAVVTYADRAELGPLVDRYLADPDERRRRGESGRAAVLAHHTFDERTRVLRDTVAELLPIARAR